MYSSKHILFPVNPNIADIRVCQDGAYFLFRNYAAIVVCHTSTRMLCKNDFHISTIT